MTGSTDHSASCDHPLDGWMRLLTTGQDHDGFNATLLPTEDGTRTLLVFRSALTHAARPGAEIKLMVSEDECASFSHMRSIYASAEWDTRNFAGAPMGAGRLGLVATRFRGAGETLEYAAPLFLFTDDNGANWRARDLPAPPISPAVSFHGDIVRWPTAAGGDDQGGFAAFSYNHWRKSIDGLYTRDNGETWSWLADLCVSDGVLADHLTECWTAPVGPQGPWIMAIRPTTSGRRGPVVLYVSHDLKMWKGPRDGGVMLSGNAPALVIEQGEAFLYTVSRRGAKRELPVETREWRGDRLLVARAPAAALAAGETDFGAQGGWRDLGPLPEQAVGYIFPRKIRGRWFAAFNFGETGRVGSSEVKRCWLGLMTPYRPVLVDAPVLRAATPHDNLVDNGDFGVWSRGDRWNPVRPGQPLADRWRADHPASDKVSAGRIDAPHPAGVPCNWLGKACAAPTGKHATVQTLGPPNLAAGARVTVALRARASGGGRLAGVRLVQDFGVGSAAPVIVALGGVTALSEQPLLYTFSSALPPVDGITLGAGAALRLELLERDADDGEGYDIVYGDVSLILSPAAALVRRRSGADTRSACFGWFRRLELRALATGAGARGMALLQASFDPMARTPLARLLGIDGVPLADAFALALSDSDVAFLVGPRPVGELVEASLELDSEWCMSLPTKTGWQRDPATPDIVASAEFGLAARAETLASLGRGLPIVAGPGKIARLRELVALEGELRALDLMRLTDRDVQWRRVSDRLARLEGI